MGALLLCEEFWLREAAKLVIGSNPIHATHTFAAASFSSRCFCSRDSMDNGSDRAAIVVVKSRVRSSKSPLLEARDSVPRCVRPTRPRAGDLPDSDVWSFVYGRTSFATARSLLEVARHRLLHIHSCLHTPRELRTPPDAVRCTECTAISRNSVPGTSLRAPRRLSRTQGREGETRLRRECSC